MLVVGNVVQNNCSSDGKGSISCVVQVHIGGSFVDDVPACAESISSGDWGNGEDSWDDFLSSTESSKDRVGQGGSASSAVSVGGLGLDINNIDIRGWSSSWVLDLLAPFRVDFSREVWSGKKASWSILSLEGTLDLC